MSTLQLRIQRQRVRRVARRRLAERRGSTLLIVLVLMTMLASLGVIFYVFSAQERASANYYSDGAKVKQFDIDRDTLFDFGIRQLIEGPQPGTFRNSALSGRRHALLPNMLGLDPTGRKFDYSPFNGTPLNPTTDAALYYGVNDSESANATIPQAQSLANRDPDYTYPDNNNMFISYEGRDPLSGNPIIIPSFHRPQMPAAQGPMRTSSTWYDAVAPNYVLRPHTGHVYVGNQGRTSTSRYMTDAEAQALWGPNVVGFPVAPPDSGNGGARGQQGVWSWAGSGAVPPYEYDVNNDGDDTYEGVWLDLDFPPLEDSAGQLYVPMFSFTVKDADGLLNLNAHGNLARVWNGDVRLDASPFRGTPSDPFLSKSNQGLYPTEVNPLWGLNRRPPVTGGTINSGDYDGAYGADPFFGTYLAGPAPENWVEAANRDWLYLLMGRFTQSPVDLVPGRWGEEHLLYRAITNGSPLNPLYFAIDSSSGSVLPYPWPGPGQTQLDDNGDTNKVTGDWYGSTYQVFGKPLDYTGLGSYWVAATPKQGNYGFAAGLPARWPLFARYSSSASNPVQWPNSGMAGALAFGLFNDAGEVVLDADFKKDEDGFFGPDEMRTLFLSSNDFAFTTGGESRITQLAPYNFHTSTQTFLSGPGRNAQEFRSKFTTRSWDRKQHSISANTTNAWWFNNHYLDPTGADNTRARRSVNASSYPQFFPPQFGSTVVYSRTATAGTAAGTTGPADLYRPVLRKLLEVEANNSSTPKLQLRLNLNQLLVGPNGNPDPAFLHPANAQQSQNPVLPPNIQLQYRPLTPHPDQSALPATPIVDAPVYPPNGSFASTNDQEFWARKDRQFMARDIFAILFTLAWPDGLPTPPTSTSFNSGGANNIMIRQMAQYAVNLVDAIDRDNIVTRFEFDVNPNNGWDLDDNPFTLDSSADRFEVYGVERAGLTLSEAAAVRAETGSSNLAYTEWDDTVADGQHFSYVELRNPGPDDVNLNTRAWRVEVGPNYSDPMIVSAPTDYQALRRLELRSGTVQEGDVYTIGSADNAAGGMNPSIMKVSTSGSAPSGWDTDQTTWIMPNQQLLDLDLKNAAQTTNYTLTDGTGAAVPTGALYDNAVFSKISGSATPLYFRLYRRLSLSRPFPSTTAEEDDNPWVLVDEIAIDDTTVAAVSNPASPGQAGVVNFGSGDTSADIIAKLANLRSRERAQPFSTHTTTGYSFCTPTGAYANTLAATNSNSPTAFTNWQKVYDRDLASLGELLHVTLGGYSNLERLRNSSISTTRALLPGFATSLDVDGSGNYLTLAGDTASNSATIATIPTDAEILFRPTVTPTGATFTPRWHRLLEVVEVSTKMQATIPGFPNPVDYPRVPGKININMVRHPEVLAALIDDPTIMSLYVDEDLNLDGAFDSATEDLNGNSTFDLLTPPRLRRRDNGTTDDWWQALVASRDGRRQTEIAFPDSTTGLYLPGTPESWPFRSFGHVSGVAGENANYAGVERTLLRSWPGDVYPTSSTDTDRPRQLLELGTLAEHQGAGVTPLDPYVRSRLLNKVMNNVTTRSNVFAVFMSVKFFRANRDAGTGVVRIGGPLRDFTDTTTLPTTPPPRSDAGWQPEYRRFFVIDRSQVEKAFDPQTGGFNFRALIEFQQDLQ